MAARSLEIVSGPAAGDRLEIDGPLVIGRAQEGPGALGGDGEISRRHAEVTPIEGDRVMIEDLGSTNGTIVNGKPIAGKTILGPGDTVEVGDTLLRVTEASAPLGHGGVHKLPSGFIATFIARAPVKFEWILRVAVQGFFIVLAAELLLRTIAVEYFEVTHDIPSMRPTSVLIITILPVLGNTGGFYMNFGRPEDHSAVRYLGVAFLMVFLIAALWVALIPSGEGSAAYVFTVVMVLIAPAILLPTLMALRVRAAMAAEERLGRS